MDGIGSETLNREGNAESFPFPRFPQEFDYENSLDQFDPKNFNFYVIRTTEVTETGFPILPPALSTSSNTEEPASLIRNPKSRIPLLTLNGNYEEIMIQSIKAYLWRCLSYTDKRRRSSRICKHKPGVKHYCRRKNWDKALSKYKSEVLDNPWLDLKTFYKENSEIKRKILFYYELSSRRHTFDCKDIPAHKYQTLSIEEAKIRSDGNVNSSDSNAVFPEESCEQAVDTLSEDKFSYDKDISSFLHIFGLKKVVPQSDIEHEETEILHEKSETSNIKLEVLTPPVSEPITDLTAIERVKEICKIERIDVCSSESVGFTPENSDLDRSEFKMLPNEVKEMLSESTEGDQNVVEHRSEYTKITTQENMVADDYTEAPVESKNVSCPTSHECCCHVQSPGQPTTLNEIMPQPNNSPVNTIHNMITDTLPRTGMWDISGSPSPQCSTRSNETRLFDSNMYCQNSSTSVNALPSFSASYPVSPCPQPCFSRQMYTQSGGMSAMLSHYYGPPCLPGPIVASQIMPPVVAYNIFPMNNVMCASHPGLIPFQCNGSYVSTAFDCNALHSPPHNSLPWTYYNQSGPLTQYHKPWVHQWVNVNASSVAPCRLQTNEISRIHMPCCADLSHGPEIRSQPVGSAYFPNANRSSNIYLSNQSNTPDIFVENNTLKFPQERK